MDVTRRYSNFENNFLTNKQKLLLKFDKKNLIDGLVSSSKSESDASEEL